MTTKRLFVSIDLPAEIKTYVKSLARPEIRTLKWMKPENLHITLNFLGYLNDAEILEVKEILAKACVEHQPFPVKLEKLKSHGGMLWLIPAANPALYNLQTDLKDRLEEVRLIKRERRPYSPHILLARTKNDRRSTDFLPQNFVSQEFRVNRINLYESKLTPDAATHILIQSFPFHP